MADWMPGVPAMGHISRGFWHSGAAASCTKCEPPLRYRAGESVVVPARPSCDIHKGSGHTVPAMVDGKTRSGPWANMCEDCFDRFGVGLGTGRGQRLLLRGEEPE